MQINIIGLTLSQLCDLFIEHGLSKLDAKRVYPWIHKKFSSSFEKMSDLSIYTRSILQQKFSLSKGKCINIQKSVDGTQKALLQFSDSACVETVFIPEKNRNTICISSQVGCAMGCKFCHTGTQGFTRNLTSSEIMAQVLFWKEHFNISNIVFMGMGEPLLNTDSLFSVLKILLDKKTHNFSRNKITVSTCGIIGNQLNILSQFGVKLALSLHATNDELRSKIMPINNKYPLNSILSAVKQYKTDSNTNHITFEYLMLKDINDSINNAKELVSILHNIPAKVNLISYNDWPNSTFKSSDKEQIKKFSTFLLKKGIRTTIRSSRGQDILAACGQLKYNSNL